MNRSIVDDDVVIPGAVALKRPLHPFAAFRHVLDRQGALNAKPPASVSDVCNSRLDRDDWCATEEHNNVIKPVRHTPPPIRSNTPERFGSGPASSSLSKAVTALFAINHLRFRRTVVRCPTLGMTAPDWAEIPPFRTLITGEPNGVGDRRARVEPDGRPGSAL